MEKIIKKKSLKGEKIGKDRKNRNKCENNVKNWKNSQKMENIENWSITGKNVKEIVNNWKSFIRTMKNRKKLGSFGKILKRSKK